MTAENIALREQLIDLKRQQNRPRSKECDRLFWKILFNVSSINVSSINVLPSPGALCHRYEWQEAGWFTRIQYM